MSEEPKKSSIEQIKIRIHCFGCGAFNTVQIPIPEKNGRDMEAHCDCGYVLCNFFWGVLLD